MARKLYTYKAKAYAWLIRAGEYALSEEDNDNDLPVVPEEYRELVATYLIG